MPTGVQRNVAIRAGGCCEVCGRRSLLELHRTTDDATPRAESVLALCHECHEAAREPVEADDTDDVAAHWEIIHDAYTDD